MEIGVIYFNLPVGDSSCSVQWKRLCAVCHPTPPPHTATNPRDKSLSYGLLKFWIISQYSKLAHCVSRREIVKHSFLGLVIPLPKLIAFKRKRKPIFNSALRVWFFFSFSVCLNANLCSNLAEATTCSHKGTVVGQVLLVLKLNMPAIYPFFFAVVSQEQRSIGQPQKDLNVKLTYVDWFGLSAIFTSHVE